MSATPFRSLVFRGTVPLQVQLEPQDLPPSADRSVEHYYLQIPRISYLALGLDDIKRNLVQLVLDHASFAALKDDDVWFETLTEGIPLKWHWPIGLLYDLHATSHHLGLLPPRPVTIPPSFASVFAPFEDDNDHAGQDGTAAGGGHRSQELPELLSLSVGGATGPRRASHATLRGGGGGPSTSSSSSGAGAVASSSRLRTPSAPPRQQGGGPPPPSSSSSTSMNRARSAAASVVPASSNSLSSSATPTASVTTFPQPPPPPSTTTTISSSTTTTTTGGDNHHQVTMATRPWRIRLRIRNLKGANGNGDASSRTAAEAAGVLDAGGAGGAGGGGGRNRVEELRTGFMALVKEADYVRWGSTKRVMNLRKELQDNLWEAVVENDFEKYWNVASKLVPLPAPPSLPSPPVGSKKPTMRTTPSSFSGDGEGGRSSSPSASSQEPDANGVKHVPLRVYLPPSPSSAGGASTGAVTVVQEPVAPTRRDGSPTTLRQALSQLVPLLFPPLPTSSSASSPAAPSAPPPPPPPPLAYPLIHGIYPPFETEVGWLGACMAGPDGWVNVVVVLDERGQPEL